MINKNFKITNNELEQRKAISNFNRTISNMQKPPANKFTEKFDEIRLRIGKIDNYLIDRGGEPIDPLDTNHIINMSNGKVVIQWLNYSGGVLRPADYGYPATGFVEDWKYDPTRDSKKPENRTLNCYNHEKASARETVDLTHAFVWNNTSNWAGIRSLPPVGSIVVCGFTKNNKVVILGYLQDETGYKVSKPHLKPGETIIKGYGNNYIHFRQSDRLDIHVKADGGKKDIEDPYNNDVYQVSVDLWQRYDGYTGNIITSVENLENNQKGLMEISYNSVSLESYDNNKNRNYISTTQSDIIAKISETNSKLYLNKQYTEIEYQDSSIRINNDGINIKGKFNIGHIRDLENYIKELEDRILILEGKKPSKISNKKKNIDPIITNCAFNKTDNLIKYAKQFIGTPYVANGTTDNGFDCAGFTQFVYKRFNINIGRTSFKQYKDGIEVKEIKDLLLGDLVFTNNCCHVGLYVGNNKYIHVSNKNGVEIVNIDFNEYCGARRIEVIYHE